MRKSLLNLSVIAALTAIFVISGCTSSIRLNVLQPADITLPSEINTMVLANRYKPAKGQGFWNVLEGAITGEWIGTDKRGAESSLTGLTMAAAQSPRFTLKRSTVELRGSGVAAFPEPLNPQEVAALCEPFNAEALVTIEAFDSDGNIKKGTYNKEVKNKEGVKQNVLMHTIQNNIRVNVGWRLYHRDGTLLDEFRMIEEITFDGEGRSEAEAERNLPSRERMVQDIGAITGDKYWHRISPMYVWVNRTYYSGGNDALKEAKRRVKVNDFSMAEKFWEKGLEDPKLKKAGRAAYNMAVAQEIKGDLQGAIEWTQKAYTEYNNKNALQYQRILERRQYDLQRLEQQMGE